MQKIHSYTFSVLSHVPSWLTQSFIVIFASFIISAFSFVSIPLPFSPIPLVLQNTLVLFIAVLLGSKRGSLAVLAFIAQGCLGLPVFSGGSCGITCLVGPTGGYLIGYIFGAFITGFIIECSAKKATLARVGIAMAIGTGVILLLGTSVLSLFIGCKMALLVGLLPFILGDILKLTFFTQLYKKFRLFKSYE